MNNKTQNGMKFILYLFGSLMVAFHVQAASFDCAKASTKVEHLICDNPELSKLDEELSAAYITVLQDEKQADSIKQAQKQWMKERNDCADVDCVGKAYRSRIDELKPTKSKDRFIPILSKNKPLCDAYKRYVEHEVATSDQYIHYASPMCQRSFGNEFPEFTPVQWREIKPEDHPELAVQAYRYINNSLPWSPPWDAPELSDKEFQNTLDEIKLNYKNNWLHMWLGKADIGNDGQVETLLKVEKGRCGELLDRPARWQIPVMVLDSTSKRIVDKSEWVLGVSVIPKTPDFQFQGMHSLLLESFDVFSISGRTYFDRWENGWADDSDTKLYNSKSHASDNAALTVYEISHGKAISICRFQFKKQDK